MIHLPEDTLILRSHSLLPSFGDRYTEIENFVEEIIEAEKSDLDDIEENPEVIEAEPPVKFSDEDDDTILEYSLNTLKFCEQKWRKINE